MVFCRGLTTLEDLKIAFRADPVADIPNPVNAHGLEKSLHAHQGLHDYQYGGNGGKTILSSILQHT